MSTQSSDAMRAATYWRQLTEARNAIARIEALAVRWETSAPSIDYSPLVRQQRACANALRIALETQ